MVFNKVYASYFNVVMNCYWFMRSYMIEVYDKSYMLKFFAVIIMSMMLLCPYFVFIDTSLSKHVDMFFDFGFRLRTSEV